MRDINEIIDEAIKSLAGDNINEGCDALVELAQRFAKAGLGQESFQNVRKYIIDEATARTDAFFIAEKLKIIERKMHEQRTRTDKAKAWTKASSRQPASGTATTH